YVRVVLGSVCFFGVWSAVVLVVQGGAVVGAPLRRGGRVDADGVLAHRPAVGADEPEGAGVGAHPLHGFGDGVHRVVVVRAPEERQPTGDGQSARVVGGQAEPVADVEHRGGEAAVQVQCG